MARMPELHFSLPKIGSRNDPVPEHSDAPAKAESAEERQERLERYVESDEFAADNTRVAKLLLNGDEDGLVEFGRGDAAQRAAARAAEIRASR